VTGKGKENVREKRDYERNERKPLMFRNETKTPKMWIKVVKMIIRFKETKKKSQGTRESQQEKKRMTRILNKSILEPSHFQKVEMLQGGQKTVDQEK